MVSFRWIAVKIFAATTIVSGFFLLGFLWHKYDLPQSRKIEWMERKLKELAGYPSAIEDSLSRIESTFIRFSGTIYPLPDSDGTAGGAMTLWDDDLIVMSRSGAVHLFRDGEGLERVKTISPPDNGFDAYVRVSQNEAYSEYLHSPISMRFNDIVFVDRTEFRGLVVSYTYFDSERICYGTRLARVAAPVNTKTVADFSVAPEDWEVFFETTPCLEFSREGTALNGLMAGGRFAINDDGRIILGSGDYHLDGIHTYDAGIQSRDTSYGKILSIGLMSGDVEIVAMGHRNVQGIAIDRNGEIWTVEHGVRGGDELNNVLPGENHGWPIESYGTLYSGQPLPLPGVIGRHDVYDKPAFAWLPSAGTSSLAAIDGFHPAWDGDLLVGSLSSKEFGQSLWHVRTEGENVQFVERIRLGQRVRYVLQYGDKIAIWTDPTNLIILRQVKRADPLGDTLASMKLDIDADLHARLSSVLNACGQCHSFEQFKHGAAPSLNGILGRPIGATDFDGYSRGLSSMTDVWTAESLTAYLSDPKVFVSDGLMPDPELTEGPLLDALVTTLGRINTNDDEHLTYD